MTTLLMRRRRREPEVIESPPAPPEATADATEAPPESPADLRNRLLAGVQRQEAWIHAPTDRIAALKSEMAQVDGGDQAN